MLTPSSHAFRRRIRWIVLPLLAVSVVLGVWLMTRWWHPTPASPTNRDPFRAFLDQHYARPADGGASWPGQGDDDGWTFEVCAQQDVALKAQPHRLFAVCGRNPMAAHAEPGRVDLFVLRQDGPAWVAVAQQTLETGSAGEPGEVRVRQLGESFFGFQVNSGWVGQGVALTTTELHVPMPSGQGFHPALSFRSSVDTEGSGACDLPEPTSPAAAAAPASASEASPDAPTNECSQLTRTLEFDTRDASARVYPLRIVATGRYRGAPVSATYEFRFDPQRFEYQAPAGFEADLE